MLEIARVAGANKKAFFALSKRAGYTAQERKYIERYFAYDKTQCAFFIARDEGSVCARVMTWNDTGYNRSSSKRCGFFSLLDGDSRAFPLLLRAAYEAQLSWGNDELIGPIAPDASGWFMGQSDGAEPSGSFAGIADAGQTEVLKAEGFLVYQTFHAYRLPVPTQNRYRESAQVFAQRCGLKAFALRGIMKRSRLSKAVFDVATDNRNLLAGQADRISGYIDGDHSFAIKNKEGRYTGYALSFMGQTPRIATIMTAEGAYRRPTVALLFSCLIDSYRKSGAETVELSVIDSRNEASKHLSTNLRAEAVRCHHVYYKKITRKE